MKDVVIVAAGRLAVGSFGGSLAKIPAPELGAHVIRQLLARAGVEPELVSERRAPSWRTGCTRS